MTTATAEAFYKALASPETKDLDLEWKVQRAGGSDGLYEAKVNLAGIVEATDDGVVDALVSVTGILDEVEDVILPGAYTKTLTERIPKGVWSHDWSTWVSRTDKVAELLPGDPSLPRFWKGKPWPANAGAARVRTAFNLGTQAGKDAFSNIKFFDAGPLGQQVEWSIGYNVPAGSATRSSQGWRLIKALKWYEYCPVLFGAMPLAGTLASDERKAAEMGQGKETVGTVEREVVTIAQPPAQPAGATLAAQLKAAVDGVLEAHTVAEGTLEVVGADWTPSDDELKALHAQAALEQKVAGVEATPGDVAATERLKHYWAHGAGAAKVEWGRAGDFDRCLHHVGKFMPPGQAKGYCALRHHEATGFWPGHAPTEQVPGTKDLAAGVEGKAAGSMAKASTPEPVGPKPLWKHKGWHLPPYIQHVANDLRGKGHSESRAIGLAVGIIKNWAHGHDGKGHKVSATTQAAAAKALAEWEKLKAKAAAERAASKKGHPMGDTTGTSETMTDEQLVAELGAGLLDEAGSFAGEGKAAPTAPGTAPGSGDPSPESGRTGGQVPAGSDEPGGGVVPAEEDELDDEDDDDPENKWALPFDPPEDYYTGGDEDGRKALEVKASGKMACGKSAADCRHTMADDSYPIHNAQELGDAVTAYPRGAGKGGKTKADIRSHVVKASKRLGLTSKVPNTWPEKREGKTAEEAIAELIERKDYPYLPGSVEERQDQLRDALRDLLLPEPDDQGRVRAYVSLDATYADRVVATLNDYSGDSDDEQTFVVPYTVGQDGEVAFAQPQAVDKVVQLVPDDDYTPDGGDADEDAVTSPPPAGVLGGASPLLAVGRKVVEQAKMLDELIQLAEAAPEGKAAGGGVTASATHVRRLRSAHRALTGALVGMGVPLPLTVMPSHETADARQEGDDATQDEKTIEDLVARTEYLLAEV